LKWAQQGIARQELKIALPAFGQVPRRMFDEYKILGWNAAGVVKR
jgi:hypothetical protein